MDRRLRLFVAVELGDELRQRVRDVADAARLCRFRRVPAEQLHLTLRFLGFVATARLGEVDAALGRASAPRTPFTVEVAGGGIFGAPEHPQVAWVGVQDPRGALLALVRSVEDELAALGFPREERPYHPHLTLGRAQGGASLDLPALSATPSLGALPVGELVLFESEPSAEGSRYTALARLPLGAGALPR